MRSLWQASAPPIARDRVAFCPGHAPGVGRGLARVGNPRFAAAPRWSSFAKPRAMSPADLDALERKIDDLLRLCARLGRENRALKAQQNAWTIERARLIEKNELAKQRVEAMISRLKALESDS